jgi:hypothetical protein
MKLENEWIWWNGFARFLRVLVSPLAARSLEGMQNVQCFLARNVKIPGINMKIRWYGNVSYVPR